MAALAVVAIARLDLPFVPYAWTFAARRREEIQAHFVQRQRALAGLWNGRVLLMRKLAIDGAALSGEFFETDFASFLAWRDWGFPDREVTNCFAMGALKATDGAYLLGVMGHHTSNPGRIYFPAGTPDPDDVAAGRVDLDGNIRREVAEETGLLTGDFEAEPGWHAVLAGPRLALIKVLRSRLTAAAMRNRVLAHIAADPDAELADVRLVAGPRDIEPAMPDFVVAFLRHVWR